MAGAEHQVAVAPARARIARIFSGLGSLRVAQNTRNGLIVAERRQRIANLYLQGWSQSSIAEQLQIAQTTVSRDLKRIQAEWRASAIRDFDTQCGIELQKLDRLECEAWAAWERSQKPSQQARVRATSEQNADRVIKNQVGDPRFLEQVHKCIAARCALLGLDNQPRAETTEPPAADSHSRGATLRISGPLSTTFSKESHRRKRCRLTSNQRNGQPLRPALGQRTNEDPVEAQTRSCRGFETAGDRLRTHREPFPNLPTGRSAHGLCRRLHKLCMIVHGNDLIAVKGKPAQLPGSFETCGGNGTCNNGYAAPSSQRDPQADTSS